MRFFLADACVECGTNYYPRQPSLPSSPYRIAILLSSVEMKDAINVARIDTLDCTVVRDGEAFVVELERVIGHLLPKFFGVVSLDNTNDLPRSSTQFRAFRTLATTRIET